MDAVEFLKERTRMCNFYMSRCMNCPGNKVAYCATLCAKALPYRSTDGVNLAELKKWMAAQSRANAMTL